MANTLLFERNLYRAVIRYKKDHPGMLEEITAARHAMEAGINGSKDRRAVQDSAQLVRQALPCAND